MVIVTNTPAALADACRAYQEIDFTSAGGSATTGNCVSVAGKLLAEISFDFI